MAKFSYSILKSSYDTILAVSDSDILGKSFSDGELQLTVSKEFYGSNSAEESEIIGLLKKATIVNAVGKSIISLLLTKTLVDKRNVIEIGGVPHAQIVSF